MIEKNEEQKMNNNPSFLFGGSLLLHDHPINSVSFQKKKKKKTKK